MVSTPSTAKSEAEAAPPAGSSVRERWLRQWGEPVVAGPIITALVISLVSIGVVGFQSLKVDMRDTEARLSAGHAMLREEIKVSETMLREEIRASEARLGEEIGRLREDMRALSDKLDRLLER